MQHEMQRIVRIGKQTEHGTGVTGTLTVPFAGDGWTRIHTIDIGKTPSSAVGGEVAFVAASGQRCGVRGQPAFNVATCRDLLGAAVARISNLMPYLTIEDTGGGVQQKKVIGCLVTTMELACQFNGDAVIVTMSLEFAGIKTASASGITAGTQGFGNCFVMPASTFTINDVQASQLRSFNWRRTNIISYPANDSDGWPADLVHGGGEDVIVVAADYMTTDWETLAESLALTDAVIVLGTGTANETITLTLNQAVASAHEFGKAEGITTEQITLTPAHDGTNRPVAVTFGSLIGAGSLSLWPT